MSGRTSLPRLLSVAFSVSLVSTVEAQDVLWVVPHTNLVEVDEAFQLEVLLVEEGGFETVVTAADTGTTYSVEPEGIVSIDADGLARAESGGQATVIAHNGDLEARALVIVREDEDTCAEVALPDDGASLIEAFHFGASGGGLPDCELYSSPDDVYTYVEQSSPQNLAYDADRGWGFEEWCLENPNDFCLSYSGQAPYDLFGPLDASPNDRSSFAGQGCPDELYDTHIGGKDFASPCDESFGMPAEAVCSELDSERFPFEADAEGIIFRVDVPNGFYRFVGAFGEAENNHSHRIVAEDGGEGPPEEIGPAHVVLVRNHDQRQFRGQTSITTDLGSGVYARVGFGGRIPPPADGVPPDPLFVNMDREGRPGAMCPDSPTLEVTEGYIRLHGLQGNSQRGPGGSQLDNIGGDFVIVELWQVPAPGARFVRGDWNGDGAPEIADVASTLLWLFGGGAGPGCMAAVDTNGDGLTDVSDPVALLSHLFLGTAAPPAPFPECGVGSLETDETLGCADTPANCR